MDETEARKFLRHIIEIGRERGFVLSHEDGHGAFEVYRRADMSLPNIDRHESWLLDANVIGEEEGIKRMWNGITSKGAVST